MMFLSGHLSFCKHYDNIRKRGIGRGGRLTICEDETLNIVDPELTISYCKKGTVLFQGNENSLSSIPLPLPSSTRHAEQYAILLLASVPQASTSITPSKATPQPRKKTPSPTKASHPPERHQRYAEAVGQPTAAPKRRSELGEIKLLLHKLCAGHLRE